MANLAIELNINLKFVSDLESVKIKYTFTEKEESDILEYFKFLPPGRRPYSKYILNKKLFKLLVEFGNKSDELFKPDLLFIGYNLNQLITN